jgi:hypothetical protein
MNVRFLCAVGFGTVLLALSLPSVFAQILPNRGVTPSANDRYAPSGSLRLAPKDEYSDVYRNADGSRSALKRFPSPCFKKVSNRSQTKRTDYQTLEAFGCACGQ